ncbi:hypothetical protein B0T21DRAFT_347042 [Apiosordaria backusii]|uniref:DUF5672 domain-containing protein n=1 Tax=Apiosordaria backusii TaxID=314023 RepID=A0AA40EIT2_9PEZI|nr:hypothetical protein B0T21DRAFT_347042 [Apiosordaria backusii]
MAAAAPKIRVAYVPNLLKAIFGFWRFPFPGPTHLPLHFRKKWPNPEPQKPASKWYLGTRSDWEGILPVGAAVGNLGLSFALICIAICYPAWISMKDQMWLRSATRCLWKVVALPVVVILCITYTLYPFALPSTSGVSRVNDALKSSSDNDCASGRNATSPSGGRYTAVIVETRLDDAVTPIILHFASVLPPWWTIVIFTLEEHWRMPPSCVFRRAVDDGKVSIQYLAPSTELKESGQVSRFFTKPCILCSRAEVTVDAFVEYDYVGAPIDGRYGQGYNGGLSLRNPNLFLQITKEVDFDQSPDEFEDQWFYKEAMARIGQGVIFPKLISPR